MLWRADRELALARDAISYGRQLGTASWPVYALDHMQRALIAMTIHVAERFVV